MDTRNINTIIKNKSFNSIEMMDIPSPISRNSIKNIKIYDEKNSFIKIYIFVSELSYALLHTFFLSLFEVIFYWSYVAIQERNAIINKTKMLSLILEPVCSFYKDYTEFDFETYIQEMIITLKTKNNTYNKNTSYSMSITLSIMLFIMYILVEIINYKLNKRLQNHKLTKIIPSFISEFKYTIYKGCICLCFVSIYEVLFFQLVIVNYNPIDSGELMLRILNKCIINLE